jgi:hypothetical protein
MSATPFGQNWPSSWTTDSTLNAATVTAGSNSSASATILNTAASPNEVLDTEVEIDVAYGATITGGAAVIYICGQVSSGVESAVNDMPFSFLAPVAASTTCHARIVVSGADYGGFAVVVGNPSGNSSITVTVKTRQSQGQIG